jgi:OmcA/MtrC family decaheme c-type cytochrome
MFALSRARRGRALAAVAVLGCALLAGCSGGSKGADGPTGATGATGPAGSPGPTGSTLAHDISVAQSITAAISGVSGGSQPTIYFNLVDQKGQPLRGLAASKVSFAIARLSPGNNGTSSTWQSYINRIEQPGSGAWWGTTPTRQATTESGAASGGSFKDNGDGTYSYKLSKDLSAYTPADAQGPAVAFDASLTHRVGLELRGTGANGTNNGTNNPVFSWLPATGATTNLLTRDIVSDKECDACHAKLALHGGPRTDVQYCVLCHNPGTTDSQSGNTLDFKVMIHKIHSGAKLPSVVADPSKGAVPAPGVGFVIWGFGGSLNNFNGVVFPQDTRNCTTCHNTADPNAADAANYQSVPNSAACGGCHDTINFITGLNHGPTNQPVTDADCVTCHGPAATVNQGAWQVQAAHVVPERVAGTKFKYNILSITDPSGAPPADGGQLKITYSVTDPTSSDAPYNLATATPFSGSDGGGLVCRGGGSARLALDVAWSNGDYTNFGSGALPAQPWSFNPLAVVAGCPGDAAATISGPDASGVYTLVTKKNGGLPAGIGSLTVVFEGHPAVDTQNAGTAAGTGWQRIAVTTPVRYAAVNDAAPVARRKVVDIARCDRCHSQLTLHGNNRTDNPQACVACHNPGATDGGFRKNIKDASGTITGFDPVDGRYEQPIDFKFMIHAIHAAQLRASQGAAPFIVYGFGNSKNDFSEVGFPGQLNDCEACHAPGTYYPVDDGAVQATTTSNGATVNPHNPNPAAATTPNMSLCSGCHVAASAITHMKQNGGSTTIQKDAYGRTISGAGQETCTICHGPGATADVKVVHGVAAFKYN